jgi:glycosyltransferase involved in cell wall biosynthesis
MSNPKVSVIIPTYGGANFLGEAIQSVLNQTYTNFELIVVNDASPDHTDEIVRQFNDPRLNYIKHEQNRGVANARKTGVMASCGEIIAHLDQDDLFHHEKLQIHVSYLEQHPEIGFTYNSRFELYPTSGAVREILRPSSNLTLGDFVLGFPLAPSIWVQRREWALRAEIWEEKTFYHGREIVICGRLYMAGCKFAMIDRVLNYRRYHRNRAISNIVRKCEAERICQQIIFDDSRCPADVLALQNVAFSNIYAIWAYVGYLQGEFETGRQLISAAVRLNPALLHGTPPALVNDLIVDSIDDEGANHETVLRDIFENLPRELSGLAEYHAWAVTRGYLMQGVRAVMWERSVDAGDYFSRITSIESQLDDGFLQWLTSHLLSYETEFGTAAAMGIIERLARRLRKLGAPITLEGKLKGYFFVNRAFENFQKGHYRRAQASVIRALLNYPMYMKNKGLLSVFMHSLPFLNRADTLKPPS